MTWIEGLPAATGVFYLLAAWGYGRRGEWGLAIAYGGYAFANCGLILAAVSARR